MLQGSFLEEIVATIQVMYRYIPGGAGTIGGGIKAWTMPLADMSFLEQTNLINATPRGVQQLSL